MNRKIMGKLDTNGSRSQSYGTMGVGVIKPTSKNRITDIGYFPKVEIAQERNVVGFCSRRRFPRTCIGGDMLRSFGYMALSKCLKDFQTYSVHYYRGLNESDGNLHDAKILSADSILWRTSTTHTI